MLTLAKLSIRRPRAALATWLVLAAALSAIGFGVASTLSPSIQVIPGTQSSRAQQLATAQFGPTQLVPILLEGPKAQLDRQGPRLVVALMKRPHTRVLSAWDAGVASAGLRPQPTAAMIVVSVDRTEKAVVRYDQPQIESLVSHQVRSPVKAFVTGQPSLDRALKDASLSTLRRDEAIAAGIVFLLLLVGLRAPLAALIVTAVGAVSMLAGFGEVALLGHVMALDPVGVALGTMTGLALAVAFSLLILDRFHREELTESGQPRDAVSAAVRGLRSTGRAVLIGGTGLILALAIVAMIGPTDLMVSLGTGMLTCAAFATGGAVVVMPAALVLLGRRIELLSFPAPAPLERAWSALVGASDWVTRRAVILGFAATALLAALAVPALALKTGPPDVSQLPAGAPARVAFQEVTRVMGPGWATPYNMIVVTRDRAITTPAVLASLERLQLQIAKDKTVYSVTGPAAINANARQLSKFWPGIQQSAKLSKRSKTDLLKLINGLGQAGAGSTQLQSGLQQAASGATQLQGGSGQAQSGATQLHAGLAQARTGSTQLRDGLNQALTGAQALKSGAGQALSGSQQLVGGLAKAQAAAKPSAPALAGLATMTADTSSSVATAKGRTTTAQNAVAQALAAAQAINDPRYASLIGTLQDASGAMSSSLTALGSATTQAGGAAALASVVAKQAPALLQGLDQLHTGAAQLESGIAQLRDGNAQLANGIGQLSGGGTQLTSGLGQLTDGAGQLETGLALLSSGTGQLASGLSGGVGPAGELITGLGQMQAAVVTARGQIPSTKALDTLAAQSPGLFSSGYFVLAALEGAQPADRNAATFTVNLLRGGTAGQIMVVSKYQAADPRTVALGTHLANLGGAFARTNHAEVAVGGPAGNLGDMTSVTKSHIWLDVGVVALALALVLAVAARAVVLAIVATAFSLLVAAAAFGVLDLLFVGANPPLGGPGYMDPMSIIGIFTIAFGVTWIFSTLLMMSTREAYVAGATSREAVRIGLRQTAAPATGAGLVAVAALIPFTVTELINVRQFGIGVAVAVLLDVVLLRPVLLPAAEAVLGRFGWWPTAPPRSQSPRPQGRRAGRLPRPHLPHPHLPRRHPGAAHQ